ncbi:MAG: c-type cytochrome [Rhodospirillaceae bacterium]|nr:c-type cytochrome [Rhodospirillaceae bacterium]MBT7955593.1 c-type cytochrome [Rhodospirillaceae bacterium]
MWLRLSSLLVLAFGLGVTATPVKAAPDAQKNAKQLFTTHCAECHGADRLGRMGPALLPQNLRRVRKNKAAGIILKGRPATQMPGFAAKLSKADADALVSLIYTPLPKRPVWGHKEIMATHKIEVKSKDLPAKPTFKADMLNLFVVVETGDHHVTILDGDKFEPITRFKSRFALHGGPKFSPEGRFVYFASRDGWITKYDIYSLQVVAEIRAGINTRNLAISHDGKVIAVANYLPHTLVLLDAEDLSILKIHKVTDQFKKQTSRVSAVYQAAPRNSFVAALKDLPEIWEISYLKNPPIVPTGLVHSYEQGHEELLTKRVRFPIRRIPLKEPLDDFFFNQSYGKLMGSSRDGGKGVVVHMEVRREIAEINLPGFPHLGSGITWTRNGKRIMATPHLRGASVSVIDMSDWSVIKRIKTMGPGFFMRSHEKSKYAWTDVFFGPNRDVMHVIDKQSLEIVKTLKPVPGKTAAHVEFTRDGRYALVSIWDMKGAIIVYDAETLQEVKRLPFVRPSGKYNVYNKIHRSEGTSH